MIITYFDQVTARAKYYGLDLKKDVQPKSGVDRSVLFRIMRGETSMAEITAKKLDLAIDQIVGEDMAKVA